MKWYVYLICFAVIITSMFAGVELWKTLSAKSHVFGYVGNNKIVKPDSTFRAEYDYLVWENSANGQKVFVDEFDGKINFNGAKNVYELRVNDLPCTSNTVTAGMISSVFSISFLTTNGTIAATAVLTISVEFLNDKTRVTIYGTNDNGALNYLNNLIDASGFQIDVIGGTK